MEKVIEIENLHKSFGEIKAVNGISFSVRKGESFSFLGVNGAGKSTTISMICGRLAPDGGSISVCGSRPGSAETARRLGVVFQNSVLDSALTARDNLRTRAALYGIRGQEFSNRLDELSELLLLSDLLERPVGKLSGGQRRRIDIARALVHRPEILILDEPTTGLDPQTRRLLWQTVTGLRKSEGLTVFLTTHYMEEAADSDYVVIIDVGSVAAEGTPLALKNAYAGDYILLYGEGAADTARQLGTSFEPIRDGVRITVRDTAEATRLITAHPDVFTDYEVIKGRMDDVFLNVTGKNLPGGSAQ